MTNKLELHRRDITAARAEHYRMTDVRAIKKHERKHIGGPLYDAYIMGQEAAYVNKPKRNPYPAGRRHDEYEMGYNQADPMGNFHGTNY